MNFEAGLVIGFFTCMVTDLIFAITNYFLQRSFFYRNINKSRENKK